MRTALLIIAALVLFELYEISLVYGIASPIGILDPPWWDAMFSSRVHAILVWLSLHHALAVFLVSVPFACVLRLLYGRHGVAVALAMTCLGVLLDLHSAFSGFAQSPVRHQVVTMLDQLKLIGTLPLVTWAVGKLPSNYRVERRVNHKLPSSGMSARGPHAER